jgi:hypothetical protein
MVSGVLSGIIPDNGFRISYSPLEENNLRTYFVKRFASRQAFDETKRPRLIIGYDDSLQDTTQGMTLDSTVSSFFFNYDRGAPQNLVGQTGELTGSNCILLKLGLPISGGVHEFVFTGSQHYSGIFPVTGIYSASFSLSSNNQHIINAINTTGSVNLTSKWTSLDGAKIFHEGDNFIARPPLRGNALFSPKKFIVSAYGLNDIHSNDESVVVKVNIFDYSSPLIKTVKLPVDSPGTLQGIVSNAFYSVRDISTQKTIIPFDEEMGSTKISSDASTLYFKLDVSNLFVERSYVVDVMLIVGGEKQVYRDVSPIFKVTNKN